MGNEKTELRAHIRTSLLAMKQANAEYYRNFLRPDVLVKNTLELVDKAIEQEQKKEFEKI